MRNKRIEPLLHAEGRCASGRAPPSIRKTSRPSRRPRGNGKGRLSAYRRQRCQILYSQAQRERGISVRTRHRRTGTANPQGKHSYEEMGPQAFRVGDIVTLQISFAVIPLRGDTFKMLTLLRSITLVDGSFQKASNGKTLCLLHTLTKTTDP